MILLARDGKLQLPDKIAKIETAIGHVEAMTGMTSVEIGMITLAATETTISVETGMTLHETEMIVNVIGLSIVDRKILMQTKTLDGGGMMGNVMKGSLRGGSASATTAVGIVGSLRTTESVSMIVILVRSDRQGVKRGSAVQMMGERRTTGRKERGRRSLHGWRLTFLRLLQKVS